MMLFKGQRKSWKLCLVIIPYITNWERKMDVMLNSTMYDPGYLNVSDFGTSYSTDINASNQTEYVFYLGPIRDSLSLVIPITVIYVLIFKSGVFGNVCTCIVISRNRHMRTTTNYYLFSLAMSDLLFLVMGMFVNLIMILVFNILILFSILKLNN